MTDRDVVACLTRERHPVAQARQRALEDGEAGDLVAVPYDTERPDETRFELVEECGECAGRGYTLSYHDAADFPDVGGRPDATVAMEHGCPYCVGGKVLIGDPRPRYVRLRAGAGERNTGGLLSSREVTSSCFLGPCPEAHHPPGDEGEESTSTVPEEAPLREPSSPGGLHQFTPSRLPQAAFIESPSNHSISTTEPATNADAESGEGTDHHRPEGGPSWLENGEPVRGIAH